MKTRIETNKHRLFFYGTLIPLLTMFGFMYSEYIEDRQTVFDTHNRANRQIELLTITHQYRIDDQSMHHMAVAHRLQEHHTQEVNELVTYYSKIIDDIKK